MNTYWLCVLLACVVSGGSVARAATINHEPLGDGIELITIEGEIKSGDEETFKRLAIQYTQAVVALRSEGGSLIPALEIGRAIHLREFATFVLDDDVCASACALVWIAGSQRLLGPRARIGFHASYEDVNGAHVETAVGNALVGRYLTQLELPERAIVFATSASPTSIRWLDVTDNGQSGISFDIVDDKTAKAAASQNTSAVGWRVAMIGANRSVSFVNTAEMSRSGDMVEFWRETWWPAVEAGVNRSMIRYRASCQTKGYETLSEAYFLNEHYVASGRPDGTVEYATPESVIDGVITAVCDGKFQSAVIDDRATLVARVQNSR